MDLYLVLLLSIVGVVSGQFIFPQHHQQHHHQASFSYQPLQYQPHFAQETQIQEVQLRPLTIQSHRAVEYNAQQEALLPLELKNPFYRNPRIAASLAKESWLTNKEMQVLEREAEKIPREQIYKIIRDAGFVHRR